MHNGIPTRVQATRILSNDDMRQLAPSVFATQPINGVSNRYAFLPTSEVIGMMEEAGFYPVRAAQTIARLPDRKPFAKHCIRFRHTDNLSRLVVGQEIAELVLTNSHDRSSAYQIMAGIWRCICSNQMCVMSADFGSISVRHSGGTEFRNRILDATHQVIEETPRILNSIEEWKGLTLTRPQQIAFANAAAEIRLPDGIPPTHLLTARRGEDYTDQEGNRDLWRTASVVQENMVRGGLQGRASTGRRITTRPIRSVDSDLKTNRAIWRLTEELARLV